MGHFALRKAFCVFPYKPGSFLYCNMLVQVLLPRIRESPAPYSFVNQRFMIFSGVYSGCGEYPAIVSPAGLGAMLIDRASLIYQQWTLAVFKIAQQPVAPGQTRNREQQLFVNPAQGLFFLRSNMDKIRRLAAGLAAAAGNFYSSILQQDLADILEPHRKITRRYLRLFYFAIGGFCHIIHQSSAFPAFVHYTLYLLTGPAAYPC